jgi:hypothetical protein
MSFIVVQHYQFPIRDPFKEGHVLTETEANVLNWHRARLIQKIVHKWVTEAIDHAIEASGDDPNTILSVAEVDSITQRITDFDAEYKLSKAKEPRTSILEYNLELLASNFLYKNGINGGEEPSPEDLARIKRVPEIQARARDLIKSGTFSLSELLG